MYANFYYQRSTKKYGTGKWYEDEDEAGEDDQLQYDADFLYIGEVHDVELFKDAELTP